MTGQQAWSLPSRRGFIRGSALSAMALPFVRQRAHAEAKSPVRVIVLTAMNGLVDSTRAGQFQCTGTDDSLVLAPQFSSLESIKNRVVSFSGLNNMTLAESKFASNGHDPALRSLLSALPGPYFAGPSVDQFIASKIGASAPFRNISMRLIDSPKTGFADEGGTWLPGIQSPQSLLDSIFARLPQSPGSQPTIDRRAVRGRGVLDFVRAQNTALRSELCGKEREMLDSHIDAVERARKAVVELPVPSEPSCVKPTATFASGFDARASANMERVRDAHVEIIAMAAACQLAPVVSYCLRADGEADYYPFLPGVNPGTHFHDYAHSTSEQKATINGFLVGTFCKLVSRLHQIPDGSGTLLDNAVVMLVSDQRFGGENATHDTANLPVVLAGGAGGALRGGRHLAYSGESFHKLLTSLCHLAGVTVAAFGSPAAMSGGGLPRLVV